jgi:hypothetical protein
MNSREWGASTSFTCTDVAPSGTTTLDDRTAPYAVDPLQPGLGPRAHQRLDPNAGNLTAYSPITTASSGQEPNTAGQDQRARPAFAPVKGLFCPWWQVLDSNQCRRWPTVYRWISPSGSPGATPASATAASRGTRMRPSERRRARWRRCAGPRLRWGHAGGCMAASMQPMAATTRQGNPRQVGDCR